MSSDPTRYEAPVAEDIDTTDGPAVTVAGALSSGSRRDDGHEGDFSFGKNKTFSLKRK